ncbi:MAG: glycosyltransferase, partial [Nitrososphaerales archaeon]
MKSLVPLTNSLGLKASWEVITAKPRFYEITKSMHNGLQGMNLPLTQEMKDTYMKVNQNYAATLDTDQDVIIIHDPQPAALIQYAKKSNAKWMWRCHIDLSQPNSDYWLLVRQFIQRYDALIFTIEDFVSRELKGRPLYLIPPCIDPLSEKNKDLSEEQITGITRKFSIDRELPIITQVSRFDPWKDPLGVIDIYRLIRGSIPKVQLLMVGGSAHDDPEGATWMNKVLKYAGDDIGRGIHLLTDLTDLEVNAIQRSSNVVIQNSIREGFGLT